MAYDVSDVELWQWGQDATFGATTVTHFIVGPKGKVGLVRDILADITTSLVGSTTVPEVMIGISSGDSTYGRYRLGTTASGGYAVGMHRASQELLPGNPPRAATDFASHVILDGGPLTSTGIAGGSYGTVIPKGRIPTVGSGIVTNVLVGVDASHSRIFLSGQAPCKDLVTGQLVSIQGSAGVTIVNALNQAVTAVDTTNFQYFEVAQTFAGTYTGGGIVWVVAVVILLAGVGGSPAGGGHVKIKVQWIGPETV